MGRLNKNWLIKRNDAMKTYLWNIETQCVAGQSEKRSDRVCVSPVWTEERPMGIASIEKSLFSYRRKIDVYLESSYIAKHSSRPINYPLKPVELWNVGLLGVGLSSIHCINNCLLHLKLNWWIEAVKCFIYNEYQ